MRSFNNMKRTDDVATELKRFIRSREAGVLSPWSRTTSGFICVSKTPVDVHGD